ncbi:hypothetical protein AVEN_114511-1, partial [Araneus ventricosus]
MLSFSAPVSPVAACCSHELPFHSSMVLPLFISPTFPLHSPVCTSSSLPSTQLLHLFQPAINQLMLLTSNPQLAAISHASRKVRRASIT